MKIKLRQFNCLMPLATSSPFMLPKSLLRRYSTNGSGNVNVGNGPNTPKKSETIIEEAIREIKLDQELSQAKLYTEPVKPTIIVKKSMWTRVKEEASHYWHGTKLLSSEVSISSRLLVKLLNGKALSRREMRQLRRTTGDLLRLVPFIIIVLIPFLEFALPVLIRVFPNMLPSTYESKTQEEEKRKRLLQVRLEMARFLQDTVAEVSLSGTSKASAAQEFSEFFQSVRMTGALAPTDDILRVARKFQDNLTLTNLSRPQLVSMAKYMSIAGFGTDTFLRSNIERKLEQIHSDDVLIQSEGVDSLTLPELAQACLSRGIRVTGVSPARMRAEMQQWIDLHLIHKVPSSLLVLSHAFQTTDRAIGSIQGEEEALSNSAEALQATLSSLPHQVVNEAQLKVSEAEGVATYKQKLDVLKEQEELIEDELEQEATQAAAKKAKDEEESALKTAKEEVQPSPLPNPEDVEAHPLAQETVLSEPMPDYQATAEPGSVVTPVDVHEPKDEMTFSNDELKTLGDALKIDTLSQVKETLEGLKEERKEFKEDIEELQQVTQKPVKVSLTSRLDKMITKIEKELVKYGESPPPVVTVKPNEAGQISISDLEETLKVIRKVRQIDGQALDVDLDDERIQKVIKKLDGDGDGLVAVQEILKLVEEAASKPVETPKESKPTNI